MDITATGRETNASASARKMPAPTRRGSASACGCTRSPSTRNMTISARYASEAWKRTMVLRNGRSALLPSVSAVMNTASRPLAWSISAAP